MEENDRYGGKRSTFNVEFTLGKFTTLNYPQLQPTTQEAIGIILSPIMRVS